MDNHYCKRLTFKAAGKNICFREGFMFLFLNLCVKLSCIDFIIYNFLREAFASYVKLGVKS